MRPASRFPVCPKPTSLESLTSWLTRIAGYYRISIDDLFLIGFELEKPKSWWDIDAKPSKTLISRIAERTGFESRILNAMTLRSYVPDVLVGLEPTNKDEVLRYTHAFSILGKEPHKARFDDGPATSQPWMRYLPWRNRHEWRQFCPACARETNSSRFLFWRTTVITTCPKHRCFLVEENDLNWDAPLTTLQIVEAGRLLIWLDAITIDALQTGIAKLWDERIPLHVWCRFLRTLQRELLSRNFPDDAFAETHAVIWRNAGKTPPRLQMIEVFGYRNRAIVAHCVAHLLYNWPERLISAMTLPKRYASRHLPFFVARHLDFIPTWPGIFVMNEEFAARYILRSSRSGSKEHDSQLSKEEILKIWNRSRFFCALKFGLGKYVPRSAIDKEFSCEHEKPTSSEILRCGATDARELGSLNLQIHSESFSQAGEQDHRGLAECSEPSC